MAKYRVKKLAFVHGSLVRPGATVEFAGKAGSAFELIEGPKSAADVVLPALDVAAAKALAAALMAEQAARAVDPPVIDPVPVEPAVPLIEIPADWQGQSGLQRINLARKLAPGTKGIKAADADRIITDEVAKRGGH